MTTSRKFRPRLVIMVKEPVPGRVKTRLGHGIGMVQAAHWYRRQSLRLIRRLRDPRWQTVLAVSPDIQGLCSRIWPRDLMRFPQGPGNVGQRMAHIFDAMPKGPVVIIGSDIPAVTKPNIARAFKALGNHDAVFGPATDGGYWLVGLKRTQKTLPGLFANTRWSSEHALTDSIATLPCKRIALVDTLSDIDTAADLARFARDAASPTC